MSIMKEESEVAISQDGRLTPFNASLLERPTGDVWSPYRVIACYDTEYCSHDGFDPDIDPTRVNFLLSMQLSLFVRRGRDQWEYLEEFKLPDGDRPKLAQLTGWALDLAGIPRRSKKPVPILLVAHYTVAEWAMLADRNNWKEALTAIGKTLITARDLQMKATRPGGHATDIRLTLRDTMLLTPGRGSLEKASAICSVPKLKLEQFGHSRADMLRLFQEDPELFKSYAMTDTRAGLEYLVKIGNKVERITGVAKLPMTLGGMSATGFRAWLDSSGYGSDAYHGNVEKTVLDKRGKQKKIKIKSMNRQLSDTIAISCFHGGRNYAARHDHVKLPRNKMVVDFDLAGAYPAAMAVLPAIDFNIPPTLVRHESELLSFFAAANGAYLPIGLGEVGFEFPTGVEPCLPVSTDYGLLYPRTGISHCGLPELLLAKARGAKIVLRSFYKWQPILDGVSVISAFGDYLRGIVQERAKHDKSSIENGLYKEAANSLYGKLAQGSKVRNVRDLAGHYAELPESQITNVVYAAMTTSLVRAALCSMEDAMQDAGAELLASTTDGCMGVFEVTDNRHFSPKSMPAFADLIPEYGQITQRYLAIKAMQQGRINLGLDPEGWIEAKHLGDEYEVFKTRGYFLAQDGKQTFIAKGGHKIDGVPDDVKDVLEELFDEDKPSVLSFRRLISCYDIADGKEDDLVSKNEARRANTDWDWKRDLQADGSSKPFEDIGEVYRHREAAAIIRKRGNRATREAVKLNLAGVKIHGGSEQTIHRMLLRAVMHHAGGWSPGKLKYAEIAKKLGVSIQDLKNAKRREYRPQTLPRGPLFEKVAADLCQRLGLTLSDQMRNTVCLPE
jgi:hypothetical protein